VRRLPKGSVAFVHDLWSSKKTRASRSHRVFLRMDSRGREILSYLEGEIWPNNGSRLSDDLLEQTARTIRRYHDAMAGSSLAQGSEYVLFTWPHLGSLFPAGLLGERVGMSAYRDIDLKRSPVDLPSIQTALAHPVPQA
jgi:hypothetical protein